MIVIYRGVGLRTDLTRAGGTRDSSHGPGRNATQLFVPGIIAEQLGVEEDKVVPAASFTEDLGPRGGQRRPWKFRHAL